MYSFLAFSTCSLTYTKNFDFTVGGNTLIWNYQRGDFCRMSAFLLKNLHCNQSNIRVLFLDVTLTFSRPVFAYVNAYRNTHLEIYFIYSNNKEICCIFKTCCLMCVLCSKKCCLFHNFIFFCSNKMFFKNHVLKFKYKPQ
jgi:hypothetical protein